MAIAKEDPGSSAASGGHSGIVTESEISKGLTAKGLKDVYFAFEEGRVRYFLPYPLFSPDNLTLGKR
jgi:hypothetical protein